MSRTVRGSVNALHHRLTREEGNGFLPARWSAVVRTAVDRRGVHGTAVIDRRGIGARRVDHGVERAMDRCIGPRVERGVGGEIAPGVPQASANCARQGCLARKSGNASAFISGPTHGDRRRGVDRRPVAQLTVVVQAPALNPAVVQQRANEVLAHRNARRAGDARYGDGG